MKFTECDGKEKLLVDFWLVISKKFQHKNYPFLTIPILIV